MRKRVLLVGGGLLAAQLWLAIACYGDVIWRLACPITQDALTIGDQVIDLGEVPIRDVRKLDVMLANRLIRPLRLRPPTASCGCLSAPVAPLVIPARGSHRLGFRFAIPNVPGPFERTLELTALEDPSVNWQVSIRGNASAPAWASPPTLQLTLDADGRADDLGVIHVAAGTELGNLVATDSQAMKLTLYRRSPYAQAYRVAISADCSGVGEIQAFDRGNRHVLLRIPVRWKCASQLQLWPATIVIDRHDVAARRYSLKLIKSLAWAGRTVQVQPLVPWIRVARKQRINERVTQVDLELVIGQSPASFDGPVIEASAGDGADSVTARAIMKSPQT